MKKEIGHLFIKVGLMILPTTDEEKVKIMKQFLKYTERRVREIDQELARL